MNKECLFYHGMSWFDSSYVRVGTISDNIESVGHRFQSTPTNGPTFTAPWWSPILSVTNDRVSSMESKNSSFESRIQSFESNKSSFESKNSSFETRIPRFESNKSSFESRISNFESKNSSFESRI